MRLLNSLMIRPRGALRLSLQEETLKTTGMVAIDLMDDDERSPLRLILWCDEYDADAMRDAIDTFNDMSRRAFYRKQTSARVIPITEGRNA